MKYGDIVAIWLRAAGKTELSDQVIRDFCHGWIAHNKIPAMIKYVGEFPMTVTGKVQQYLMREQMVEELNLVARKTA
ncbi:MAG: hypothetical protein GXP04_00830 [Alphaproteobacteria bacterium]|nr:hypothetical protein [Alphaproteobacteria bacterium]